MLKYITYHNKVYLLNIELKQAIKLDQNNKISEAKSLYLKLEKILHSNDKDLKIVCLNLANIYVKEKNEKLSILYYEKANNISIDYKIYYNIAVVYLTFKKLHLAKENFIQSLKINQNYIKAYINLGITYKQNNEELLGIQCFKKASLLNDKDPDIYYNWANALMSLENFEEARQLLSKVLILDSHYIKAYYTLGLVSQKEGKYKESLDYFNKALENNDDYFDAHFAKATTLLMLGDYENGWKEYYYRWDANNELNRPSYDVKWWNKEPLLGKRILVQQEQGFGDNIQFVRYIPILVSLGAEVFLAIKSELYTLFKSIENITLIQDKNVVKNIDYFTSLLELPRLLYNKNNKFITNKPYLFVLKNNKQNLIKNLNKTNVGFVWQGNRAHKGDSNRSLPLEVFEELFQNSNLDLYSLQFGLIEQQKLQEYITKYNNIFDITHNLRDFNDTANVIQKLDLVITIDSAMAHLCGALGVKCYLLLHKYSEWRWLLNTTKTPWYNSVNIVRLNENITLNTIMLE